MLCGICDKYDVCEQVGVILLCTDDDNGGDDDVDDHNYVVDDNDHVEFDQKEHEVIKDERGVSATNWQIPFLEATTFHLPQFMRIYNWLLS